MEGDVSAAGDVVTTLAFQSTPSAWRETALFLRFFGWKRYFNPLPPHGGRLSRQTTQLTLTWISIHSLRMEGDTCTETLGRSIRISIHSLRMEGDRCRRRRCRCASEFQSTPSAWRETLFVLCRRTCGKFQSTPSAWRETLRKAFILTGEKHFNPLPPHGGRLNKRPEIVTNFCISIHSLRMEGDWNLDTGQASIDHFNPLPPHGGRRCTFHQ